MRWGRALVAGCLAVSVCGVQPVARASIPIYESDPFTWTLGGYARMLGGVSVPNAEAAGDIVPDLIGLSASVLRFEWGFKFADVASLEVHNRFYLLLTSQPSFGGGTTGVGVTRAPERTLNLRSEIATLDPSDPGYDGFLLEHDLDRLVLRFFVDKMDLSIGRQAITWGISNLFTVADVWAAFSPFDLDTSQKRGIDAVRAVFNFGTMELDIVGIADRGVVENQLGEVLTDEVESLSGGVRAVFYTDVADIYVALGKFWMDVGLAAGIVVPVDVFKLRLEALGAYAIDEDKFRLPRVTVGLDWFPVPDLVLGLELHYNGFGTERTAHYLNHSLRDATIARGQNYLLGRYYAGLLVSGKPHELVTLGLTAMANLSDPSGLIGWTFSYAVAQDVELGLAGFHGIGSPLVVDALAGSLLQSEFGSYGHQVYLQLAAFF